MVPVVSDDDILQNVAQPEYFLKPFGLRRLLPDIMGPSNELRETSHKFA